jgi:hypothetical protein
LGLLLACSGGGNSLALRSPLVFALVLKFVLVITFLLQFVVLLVPVTGAASTG